MTNQELAGTVMKRIEALAKISEEPDRLTRTYGSPAMRQANELVGSWMKEAGMTVSEDAIGNLIGRLPGRGEGKTFILGSHLDSVRNAGKFDGPLGVLTAIACVQQLEKNRLPFNVEVAAFADGDGARFETCYLGSRALAGTIRDEELKKADAKGISLAEAIRAFGGNPEELKGAKRDPQELLGYAEIHIEQGPVLERKQQPVGVVTAFAGQTGRGCVSRARRATPGRRRWRCGGTRWWRRRNSSWRWSPARGITRAWWRRWVR